MADTFELEIATPDRLLVKERVREAQIPAAKGYIGVLPEHSPFLELLGIGELTYDAGGRRASLAVAGGFVEVLPDRVRVLAERAERAEEIDVERARRALERAEQRLENPLEGKVDIARALNAMKRAQARLQASRHR